jgi:sRNA-binding carbon storage regulator CsrA
LIMTIDLKIGEELAIGDAVVVALLARRGRIASIGVACPDAMRVRRSEAVARRPILARPALDMMPGVTRRPGPPVQRRITKGGTA